MPKARVNSTTVSLTEWELERLRNLYSAAWGSYEDKTVAKLEKAMGRIKAQKVRAAYMKERHTQKVREREEEEGNVGP